MRRSGRRTARDSSQLAHARGEAEDKMCRTRVCLSRTRYDKHQMFLKDYCTFRQHMGKVGKFCLLRSDCKTHAKVTSALFGTNEVLMRQPCATLSKHAGFVA